MRISIFCTSSLTKESPLRSLVCRLLPSSLSSTLLPSSPLLLESLWSSPLLLSPSSSPLLLMSLDSSPLLGSSPLLRPLSSLSSPPRLRPSSFSSTLLLSLRLSQNFQNIQISFVLLQPTHTYHYFLSKPCLSLALFFQFVLFLSVYIFLS